MTYEELEQIISKPRDKRYLTACAGVKEKAVDLYFRNIEVGTDIFKMIAVFEVAFRNRINGHLVTELKDEQWLRAMGQIGSYLNTKAHKTFEILQSVLNAKVGSHANNDKILAEMSLGFWTNLYLEPVYESLGWNLISIFTVERLTNPKAIRRIVYSKLSIVLGTRNRICHLEPLFFNRLNHLSLDNTRETLDSIVFLTTALVGNVDYLSKLDAQIRKKLP
jgi:hypothetical protein